MEPLPFPLIAPRYGHAGVTELLLDLILVGIGGPGETGAQRVAWKFPLSVSFGEIPSHAGGKCCALDEAHDVFVVEAVDVGLLTVFPHTAEKRSVRDASEG
jgi:hypothetical protein